MIKKRTGGFTLIEILIVVAIIGILAGAILVSVNSARLKSRDNNALSTMNSISKLAFSCVLAGNTNINLPLNLNTGGGNICLAGATETYPSMAANGWRYYSRVSVPGVSFAIGAQYPATGAVTKKIICGYNYNTLGWFSSYGGGYDFRGKSFCWKSGF